MDTDYSKDQRLSLLDILDTLLAKGVFIKGDLMISIANIDLVYIDLRLLITAVEKFHENSSYIQHDFKSGGE